MCSVCYHLFIGSVALRNGINYLTWVHRQLVWNLNSFIQNGKPKQCACTGGRAVVYGIYAVQAYFIPFACVVATTMFCVCMCCVLLLLLPTVHCYWCCEVRCVCAFIAHSINYIHEIYFHQIAFKRLMLMLLLNVQPSVKHHRNNRQNRSFKPFSRAQQVFIVIVWVCVWICICVCCCERERERYGVYVYAFICLCVAITAIITVFVSAFDLNGFVFLGLVRFSLAWHLYTAEKEI